VSEEISVRLGPAANYQGQSTPWVRQAGVVVAGSALVAACAHVSLPLFFTPVPLTLQPFAVLLLGLVLRPGLAAATLGAYLAEGALGLPVFAPVPLMAGGVAHLVGPTGGFLLSYPLAAPLISWLWRRIGSGGFASALASAGAGNLVILACGSTWFGVLAHAPVQLVLSQAVIPFLPGDALKIAAAAALGAGFARIRRRSA
jgi:biotin transport system substrate-specific component